MQALAQDNLNLELESLKNRVLELESSLNQEREKSQAIAEEVEKNKLSSLIPEKAELKSEYGLGPAASSVYKVNSGLSIGGYGEATFRKPISDRTESDRDVADFLRVVQYTGYKFNDWLIFNSEIEFEHGTTGSIGDVDGDSSGSISVELAYLDFLLDDAINARVGLLLMPLGFVNEIHEPPFFHGVVRPEIERRIIPTTFRENGLGIFGNLGEELEYRAYLVNGLRASRFRTSGIRGGRQSGNRALFEDVAFTGRLDYQPNFFPGSTIGVSTFFGNSGQDDDFNGQDVSAFTSITDVHAQFKLNQFEFKALGIFSTVDDTEVLNVALDEVIGEEQFGWYVELAYDVLPHFAPESEHYLAPFVRFESFDTQSDIAEGFTGSDSADQDLVVVGFSYKPVTNVVLKLDYRNFSSSGDGADADEIAFGIGYAY